MFRGVSRDVFHHWQDFHVIVMMALLLMTTERLAGKVNIFVESESFSLLILKFLNPVAFRIAKTL